MKSILKKLYDAWIEAREMQAKYVSHSFRR